MRRAETVGNFVKFFRAHIEIIEEVLEIAFWKLAIVSMDECDGLLAGDMSVANLLRGFMGAAANAELDVAGPVMKAIDAVVDGIVLRKRAFRPLGVGFERRMLD